MPLWSRPEVTQRPCNCRAEQMAKFVRDDMNYWHWIDRNPNAGRLDCHQNNSWQFKRVEYIENIWFAAKIKYQLCLPDRWRRTSLSGVESMNRWFVRRRIAVWHSGGRVFTRKHPGDGRAGGSTRTRWRWRAFVADFHLRTSCIMADAQLRRDWSAMSWKKEIMRTKHQSNGLIQFYNIF